MLVGFIPTTQWTVIATVPAESAMLTLLLLSLNVMMTLMECSSKFTQQKRDRLKHLKANKEFEELK